MDRRIITGAVLIVAGMAIIGLIDNFVRLAAETAGLWQFHLSRSVMGLPILALAVWFVGADWRPKRAWYVIGRTGFQASAMLLYFSALPMLPIAQVAAGLFTAPIFVLIFSMLLFRRPVGPRRILAVAVGFLGVLILLRPDAGNLGLWSVVPVLAGALYAMGTITTRQWCADEPLAALLGMFFVLMGLASVIGVVALGLWPQEGSEFVSRGWVGSPGTTFYLVVLVQAAGSLIAVGMLTRGYQSGETSFLTVFEYSFLIFASIWGWVIWGEALGLRDLLGMAMIIGAGVAIALRPPLATSLSQ